MHPNENHHEKSIGTLIKAYMERKGYRQKHLAELLNVNQPTISRIINNKGSLLWSDVKKLADFFELKALLRHEFFAAGGFLSDEEAIWQLVHQHDINTFFQMAYDKSYPAFVSDPILDLLDVNPVMATLFGFQEMHFSHLIRRNRLNINLLLLDIGSRPGPRMYDEKAYSDHLKVNLYMFRRKATTTLSKSGRYAAIRGELETCPEWNAVEDPDYRPVLPLPLIISHQGMALRFFLCDSLISLIPETYSYLTLYVPADHATEAYLRSTVSDPDAAFYYHFDLEHPEGYAKMALKRS